MTDIYDNCIIQAPDGVTLSRCSRKKLDWYLNRDLADLVAETPPTIRLRFEPSGRRGLDDPTLLEGKPNLCVICGSPENLTRHHIIPYSFIRYMRLEYKLDIIKDIFPVCRDCHDEYEKKSERRRMELAERYGLNHIMGVTSERISQVRRGTSAAAALLQHQHKMPAERREVLLAMVRELLGKEEVTEDDLRTVKRHKITEREDYVNPSRYIAQRVGDYNEFAKEWRQHFVDTMQPKFMPSHWKVDRKTDTDQIWVPPRILKQKHQM